MRLPRLPAGVLAVCAVVPFFYIALPLLHLLRGLGPGALSAALADPTLRHAAATSALAALVSTGLAVVFGIPAGYLLSLPRLPVRPLLEGLVALPLVLPPVVGGIAQMAMYGPNTLVGGWAAAMGWPLTGSFAGVVLAQTYITSPYMILSAKAGFEDVPIILREAALTLGAGRWDVFWYVALPLARSALLSGAVLTFARSVGEFGATMIVAYHPYTLPVALWVDFTANGLEGILPIAALVALTTLLIAVLAMSLERRPSSRDGAM
ncbi:MAG: ABC transporter permease subunit [Thermoflavifilum sp.]|nr:ABC transporter permease subunit [Thermoflavifilum sp.]MCL6514111.1 ABC transporter permease subunit [Alicyclobacillus sp.]